MTFFRILTSMLTHGLLCAAVFSAAIGTAAQDFPTLLSDDAQARQAMAVAASVTPPDQATTDIIRLAGEYGYGNGFDINCTLVISPDGRFLYKQWSCENVVDQATGRITVQTGLIFLQTANPRTEWPHGMASVMVPVTWGQRLYLVPQNDILGFSNQVNRGVEPVSTGSMGSYFLREGDWDRPAEGKPNLPSEWKERLLEKPVTGTVAGKDTAGRWIINLGKSHGVYNGMELSAWGPELRRFVTIIVTETTAHSSAVRIVATQPDVAITGWTVYSRVVPPGQDTRGKI